MNIYIPKEILKYIIVSFILAIFITFFPWDGVNPRGFFIDRDQYFFNYDFKRFRLDSIEVNKIYDYIFQEWIWHYLTGFSRNVLNLDPIFFFGFITFITCFAYSLFISIETKKVIPLIYLANPDFIVFVYSQLRLALAMSLFLMAIYLFNKKKIIFFLILMLISLSVHTSMLFFWVIFFISLYISKLKNKKALSISLILLTGLIITFLIGPIRGVVLEYFGDRRVEYDDMSSPPIYLLIFALYFFTLIFSRYKDEIIYSNYIYIYSYIIFSLVFFTIILGGYSLRFVYASYFFIVVTFLLLKGKLGIVFHYGFILYLCMAWYVFLT